MNRKKIISFGLIIILVLNLVLMALGRIKQLYFWIVIAVIGIIAYKVMPKI